MIINRKCKIFDSQKCTQILKDFDKKSKFTMFNFSTKISLEI